MDSYSFVMATVGVLLVLGGCAQTSSISKLGKDTYTVTAYRAAAAGGTPAARGAVLDEAGTFCTKMGKEIMVKNISHTPAIAQITSY